MRSQVFLWTLDAKSAIVLCPSARSKASLREQQYAVDGTYAICSQAEIHFVIMDGTASQSNIFSLYYIYIWQLPLMNTLS